MSKALNIQQINQVLIPDSLKVLDNKGNNIIEKVDYKETKILIQPTEKKGRIIDASKIKHKNNVFYKTVLEDNTLIYQGYLEKVEGKKIPCFISRIFSRDQEGKEIIYERIVYIDKEEINPDNKLVDQFNMYDNPKKIENFFQKKTNNRKWFWNSYYQKTSTRLNFRKSWTQRYGNSNRSKYAK